MKALGETTVRVKALGYVRRGDVSAPPNPVLPVERLWGVG